MTTRALAALEDADRTAILELLDDALAAATAGVDDTTAWIAADHVGHRPTTGHKLARRTWTAGQIAAHALRLAADSTSAAGKELAQSASAAAINSTDWDERTYATLRLRTTFKHLEDPVGPEIHAARRVAAWLRLDGGPQLPSVTARLCRTARDQAAAHLGRAWYATHGRDLLRELSRDGGLAQGNATASERAHRTRLRRAVVEVHDADPTLNKKALAETAGITRATLESWIKQA